MANQSLLRIAKDEDIRNLKALILGTPGSPYEYGFFEFSVKFGPDYPSKPPKVDAKTTNNGRTRFNPNIYAGGKVCLSILGTWQGELPGEEWSSAQGLESVLWSIQSLMSNDPYANEPGFEGRTTDEDKKKNDAYCAKIRHETIRIAVLQKLEHMFGIQSDGSLAKPADLEKWHSDTSDSEEDEGEDGKPKIKWEPFNDWQKRRFLWYYETYLNTIEAEAPKYKEGDNFEVMPFEGGSNTMSGTFQYVQLGKRLLRVKEVIQQETANWAKDGLIVKQRDSSKAYAMQGQFNVVKHNQTNGGIPNIDLELENDNPFVWIMTYFGRPESNLDGGVFKIRVSISVRFPEEQPRVQVVTPMYHHRVSKDGILCYQANKPDEMKNHIQMIVHAIEEECPPYDPRTIVNPEVAKLFFGSADDKKKYNRSQRRSAQDSLDFAE
ncbi:hypothetical protein LTR51_005274 [Lithohypha guttulata]|uniref:Ubiquitin-conjugating enzyme E2 Z n=1 Tax=Lithohypha guttulata TaxID=1690604 RepID=A0AAN7T345_9EURO|nr:hypothetical protein LTR51_005274 [Lithohypha guttulata]KAK5088014.1 hypothetical protein LTR05_002230 [Lithohypha guttulata]